MVPRDISSKIRVNDEYNLDISSEGIDGNLPNTSSFESVKIETYCPHCFSKHKLQYSGFLPKNIGYRCDECSEIRHIHNQHSDGKTYVGDLAESLVKEMKIANSSICGYNYAKYKNGGDDLYEKIKKFRRSKFEINMFYFVSFISFIFGSLLLLTSINLTLPGLLTAYPLSFLAGFKIIMMMNKKTEKYIKNFDIKDSKLDTINLKWFQHGLEKGMEENLDSSIKSIKSIPDIDRDNKKIKSHN